MYFAKREVEEKLWYEKYFNAHETNTSNFFMFGFVSNTQDY